MANDEIETRDVTCRICQKVVTNRGMLPHLVKHQYRKQQYIDEFPGTEDDFVDFMAVARAKRKANLIEENLPPKVLPAGSSIEDELLSTLSDPEREFYDNFTDEVFGQIDRDMVQFPIIMSLTLDMIQLKRYRSVQISQKGVSDDAKVIAAQSEAMKSCEDRIRKQMDSLGISRTAKLKNKAQIRSTPFSLISGYFDEMERMTPEQHQVLENEERKQLASMLPRIKKWYLDNAPDLEPLPEETEDGVIQGLDFETILAAADIEL